MARPVAAALARPGCRTGYPRSSRSWHLAPTRFVPTDAGDNLDPIVRKIIGSRYEIAPGTEGIAFGSAGRLWAVSEAGSRHIYDYPFLGLFEPFFPLVFALDLSRLE